MSPESSLVAGETAGAPGYRLDWHDRIAEIALRCGKANALNARSLAALDRALDEAVEGDARGVVLTGYDRFFSAGLDLVGLYDLDRAALDALMREFDRVTLRAFAFPRPLVTAIGGHAVAGGGVLALAGDWRVMAAEGARIGLNEIRLGVPFPAPALEIVRYAVAPAFVEAVLYDGELYDGPGAHARGLVHVLAPGGPEELLRAAREACQRLAARPSGAFAVIKAALRGPGIERARERGDALRRAFVDAWLGADGRRLIGEARARLRG